MIKKIIIQKRNEDQKVNFLLYSFVCAQIF